MLFTKQREGKGRNHRTFTAISTKLACIHSFKPKKKKRKKKGKNNFHKRKTKD